LFAVDRVASTSWTVSTNWSAFQPGLRFSADNHFLAYAATLNRINQVCLYDFTAGTNLVVSRIYNSTTPGNDSSDSPDISADGRFVAYRSAATNLLPGATNGLPGILLFDRQTGVTTLLSVSRFGNFASNCRSLCPVFSADGQTLAFQTWAADVAGADFNQTSDVVAYSLYTSGQIPVFCAAIYPGSPSSLSAWVTWPAAPDKSYRLQFKNSVNDSNWQELGGTVTIFRNQGYCHDLAPTAIRRFYRVVGY
jgi:hypothetical protein